MSPRRPYWPWLTALLLFGADQLTKFAVVKRFPIPGDRIEVFPPVFFITRVHNTGGLFGMLAAHDTWYRFALLTVLPVGALLFISVLLARQPAHRRWALTGLALVLGGAAGNVVDRLRLGYVVDFLDFFFGTFHYPTFNVADSAILSGIGCLVIHEWRLAREAQPAPGERPQPDSATAPGAEA